MQVKTINKKLYLSLMVLIILFTFQVSLLSQKGGWKLKKEKDGIEIYTKDGIANNLKEIKINTLLKASLSSITAALSDINAYPEWVYKCIDSKPLYMVGGQELYFYTETNLPWPLQNRDLVLHNITFQDPVTKTVFSSSVTAEGIEPEKEGIVRVPYLVSKWVFTPLKNGTVHLSYYLNSDPGGSIPDWLVNMAIEQGPFQTMKKFRELVKKEKYKNVQLPYIQELETTR